MLNSVIRQWRGSGNLDRYEWLRQEIEKLALGTMARQAKVQFANPARQRAYDHIVFLEEEIVRLRLHLSNIERGMHAGDEDEDDLRRLRAVLVAREAERERSLSS